LSFEPRLARLQDNKNKQNSIHLDLADADHRELAKEWLFRQQAVIRLCKSTYEWAVNNGIAKEVARAVLPEGLTQSRLYMNGSLRSWIHFIDVRTDESTQIEHREVAKAVANVISEIFPMSKDFDHSSDKF
jgi:thymidylate synthase (FAD)